jgi:hypothetical protein
MIFKRFPVSTIRVFVLPAIQTIGARTPQPTDMLYSPHMGAKKTTLNELGAMLAHVVKHMATKDDLAAAETRLDRRIDKLDAKIDSVETKSPLYVLPLHRRVLQNLLVDLFLLPKISRTSFRLPWLILLRRSSFEAANPLFHQAVPLTAPSPEYRYAHSITSPLGSTTVTFASAK